MPIGGETIGRAYVKIIADGDGFGDEIRKELADSDKDWKALGHNASDKFKEGKEEEDKKWSKKSQKKLLDQMNKSLGKWEQSGKWSGTRYAKGLQDLLHRKMGTVGDQMFKDMNEEIRSGRLDFTSLDKQLDNLGPRFASAAKKVRAAMEEARREQERIATAEEKDAERRWKASQARLKRNLAQQTAAEAAWQKENTRRAQAAFKEADRWAAMSAKVRVATQKDMQTRLRALQKGARDEDIRHTGILMNNLKKLSNSVDNYQGRLIKTGGAQAKYRTQLVRLVEAMPEGVRKLASFQKEVENIRRRIDPAGSALGRFRNQLVASGNATGKFFGRGSRNNFLNFFGGFVSLAPRAIGALGKMTEATAGFVKEFRAVAKEEGPMAALGGVFSMLGKNAPGAILAVAGALGSIATVLPLAGAAISGLTGLVLALAGSLGFALVGGVVAVAGALVPLAAAFGVVALAMGQMNKKAKNKEFMEFTKGLRKDWKGLQEDTSKALFGKNLKNLSVISNVLKTMRPVIMPVAKAMGGLLKSLGEATGTKEFAASMKSLGKTLAPMVTTLGTIAGNLAVFLGEAFTAATPMISEFLGWLAGVTGQMAEFGKGGDGSGLSKFFNDAWDSAKKVGRVISDVLVIVGGLLGAGKDAGDSLFTSMAEQAEKLITWMSSDEGKKSMAEWFDFARRIGEKLGGVVLKVIEFVDALDTPASRQALELTLDVIIMIGGWLVKAAGWMDKWTQAWLGFRDVIIGIGTAIGEFFAGIPAFFGALPAQIRGTLATMKGTVVVAFREMWSAVKATASEIGSTVGEALTPILDWFAALPSMIGGHLATMKGTVVVAFSEIGTAIGDTISDIGSFLSPVTTFFSDLGSSIAENLGRGLDTIKLRLSELPGQIVQAFVNLPANIWTFVQQMIAPFVWLYNELVGHSIIPDMIMDIVGWFARLPGMIAGVLGNLSGRFVTWLAGVPQKIQSAVGLVVGAFGGLAGKAIARAGNIVGSFAKWVAGLAGKAKAVVGQVIGAFGNWAGKIIAKAGSLSGKFASWVSSLAGKARSVVGSVVGAFANMAGKIISKAGSITSKFGSWVSSLPGKAKTIASNIASAFSGLAGKIISRAGDIASKFASWGSKAVSSAGRVASNIVSKFSGLASRIVNAIGNIVPKIKMPNIPRPTVNAIVKVIKPKGAAAGGIFAGPTIREIGEAGPEAVVPLNRALSRVDPAVRALSAFAQGMTPATAGPSIGRQIDVGGITINTPTTDPRAVASEVVTRLTFASYI